MSFGEIFLLGMIGVLLFGKQLPDVGRKVGKTFGELKRSYDAFRREMNAVVSEAGDMSNIPDSSSASKSKALASDSLDEVESVAPKFELPKDSNP